MPGSLPHIFRPLLWDLFRLHNQRDGFVGFTQGYHDGVGSQGQCGTAWQKARPDILYAYDWKSSRERIEYWVSRESDIAYAARIRVTHVPSMAEIERIARDEQNRYFSQ